MVGREVPVAAALVALLLAGCFSGAGPEASPPINPSGATDEITDVVDLSYHGTATMPSAQPVGFEDWSELRFPSDALEVNVSLAATSPTGSGPWLDVVTPSGAVQATMTPQDAPILLPRSLLMRYGDGAWTFRVYGAQANQEYDASVAVSTGTPAALTELAAAPVQPAAAPGVVVAIIDSGVNLYHEAFASPHPLPTSVVDATTGEAPVMVQLSTGTRYEEARRADEMLWRALEPDTLYAFPQLNMFGVSLWGQDVDAEPVMDFYGHGTGTASRVRAMAPNATILIIDNFPTPEHTILAYEWAAQQPWIDIISVSRGFQYNYPREPLEPDSINARLAAASRQAHLAGKMLVGAAGNDPTFSQTDGFDGPPWMMSITGAQPETRGRSMMAAHGMDYAASYVVEVPSFRSQDGWEWTAGTSFAAPMFAGALAQTLLDVRIAHGHLGLGAVEGAFVATEDVRLDASDFRAAFNQTAILWQTADYDPTQSPNPTGSSGIYGASAPVGPAPYVDLGWGFVDQEVGKQAAEVLLGAGAPSKSPDAIAYQETMHSARQSYWT